MIFIFGVFCCMLGHFGPRQLSTFWPIYFMLFYSIAGLWFGYAFIVIGACRLGADAGRLFLCRQRLRSLDGVRQWRRADPRRPLDAAGLSHGRARRHHPPAAAPADHGGAERAAGAAGLEFSRLKKLTGATDGNLGAHIETLAKAGYVAVDKAFVGKKPQTTVTATAAGRGAFARHVATLQEIIAASGGDK